MSESLHHAVGRYLWPGLVLAALAFSVEALLHFPRWTVDDAYITCRYAENLALHGELNWNPGEDPVEGYTGVALPVILAGVIKCGGDPVRAAKWLGVLGFFGAAIAVAGALRSLGATGRTIAVALALFLTAPFQFRHVTGGLETMLYAFALVAALWAALACCAPEGRSRLPLLMLTLLFAGLIRPEGALLGPLLLIILFLLGTSGSSLAPATRIANSLRPLVLPALLCYLLPAAGYFLWRYNYYGHFLPNTFHAKHASGFNMTSLRSLLYFLSSFVALPLGASLAARLHSPPGPNSPTPLTAPQRRVIAAFILFIAIAFLQYTRSIPLMNYAYRFYAPYYALLLVLIMAISRAALPPHSPIRVLPPILLAAQIIFSLTLIPRERAEALNYKTVLEDEHIKAAALLKSTLPPGARIISFCDAGAIAYLTRLKVTDFGVLNDTYLARSGATEKEMIDYFFSVKADAVVFTSLAWDHLHYAPEGIRVPTAETIAADPRFADYRLAEQFRTMRTAIRQTYFEFVYLRKTTGEAGK